MNENIRILSGQLRGKCRFNGKEIDPQDCAEVMFKIGEEYKRLAETSESTHERKLSLIRSAVMLNAAVVRRPENDDFKQGLCNLCQLTVKLANAETQGTNLVQKSHEIVRAIVDIRKTVAASLDEFAAKSDRSSKTAHMEKLQQIVTDGYKSLMIDIMDYSVSLMGPLPCKYALIGMGSLARNEITPYSDFEHAYLLEDGIDTRDDYEEILEYFRWVSVIFHVVVINLGETIVASAALPYINDQERKSDDWFFDENTPRGISFDGMMAHASKFPLGRSETKEKQWRTELIKPVSEMLKYQESDEAIKNGYRLAEVLENVCFVSGSRDVYEVYEEGLSSIHEREDLSRIAQGLDDDLKNFSVLDATPRVHESQGFHVKSLIYRRTSLFVAALGRIYHILAQSTFDIVRKLFEKNAITRALMEDILFSLSLACEVRLRVYTKRKGQYDLVSESLVRMLGKDDTVKYFETVMRLQLMAKSQFGAAATATNYSDHYIRLKILHWLAFHEQALAESRVMLQGLPGGSNDEGFCLHSIFFSLYMLGRHAEACEVYERLEKLPRCSVYYGEAIEMYKKACEKSDDGDKKAHYRKRNVELIRKMYQEKCDLSALGRQFGLAVCLLKNNNHEEALECFTDLETTLRRGNNSRSVVTCELGQAKCHFGLGDDRKAITCFQSVLASLDLLQKQNLGRASDLDDTVSCHVGLGKSYYNCCEYDLSCRHFAAAFEAKAKMDGTSYEDPEMAVYEIINEVTSKQEVAIASKYLEVQLAPTRKAERAAAFDVGVASLEFALATCYFALQRYKESLLCSERALEENLKLGFAKDMLKCYTMLAMACFELGKREQAVRHLQAALKLKIDAKSRAELCAIASRYLQIEDLTVGALQTLFLEG